MFKILDRLKFKIYVPQTPVYSTMYSNIPSENQDTKTIPYVLKLMSVHRWFVGASQFRIEYR